MRGAKLSTRSDSNEAFLRLSQHSDYAYRMLMHVALRAPSLTTVGDIAQAFQLSATHLNKVAQTLAASGYLQTVRGRSGGLRLVREPDSIRLGQVALSTEPDFQMAPCMSANGDSCPIYDPCLLRSVLSQATTSFIAELDKWTLADLIKKQQPLLLAINLAGMKPIARLGNASIQTTEVTSRGQDLSQAVNDGLGLDC